MYYKLKRKSVQRIMCFFYILVMTLFMVGITLYFGNDENKIRIQTLLISVLISFIIIIIVTENKKIRDFTHGIYVILLSQLIFCGASGMFHQYAITHFSFMYLAILICIYEILRLSKLLILISLCWYVVLGVIAGFLSEGFVDTIVAYSLCCLAVIFGQIFMSFSVSRVERYKKVIKENNRSSKDVLKLVELKRQEAEDSAKAKSMFLSSMSHEIRTPINVVLGLDEMIIRESHEKNIEDYAVKIKSAGNTLLEIINDVLDFSKIETGKMRLTEEEYNIVEQLREIYDLMHYKADEKNLEFKLNVDKNIPVMLYGDSLRIKQIFINIISNAIKYTQKGSVEVNVSWHPVVIGCIELLIEVKDTGVGIDEKDYDKVFDSFERIENSDNRNIEGTGLGMSITKGYVELMGGKISFSSKKNQGTVFRVRIDQKVVDYKVSGNNEFGVETVKLQKSDAEEFRFNKKVLFVDDNEMNLFVVKNLLKNSGLVVDTALSGKECISMTKACHYDMIFLDNMMPELDGIETLKALKNNVECQIENTPVIVFTADALDGSKERYISMGFDDYISKPVSGNMLEKILTKYLKKDFSADEMQKSMSIPEKNDYVNYSRGMMFASNDSEQYFGNIKFFLKETDKRQNHICSLLLEEKISDYVREVHSLKSNASYLGADMLEGEARLHEQLGNENKVSILRERNSILLRVWDDTVKEFEAYIKSSKEDNYGPKKSSEEGSIDNAIRYIKDYDVDNAIDEISRIKNDKEEIILEKAIEELENFNYKAAETLLCGLKM